MLRRFRKRRREAQQWNTEHDAAWSQVLEKNDSGLTLYQAKVESIIEAILAEHNLQLSDRKVEGGSELYITGKVAKLKVKVWIYEDQTDISNPGLELRLECWDTKTPEEHYAIVAEHLESVINNVADAT